MATHPDSKAATPRQATAPSPVEHAIKLKTALIKSLRKKIEGIRAEADAEIKQIETRIFMAQTLLNALQKGK